MSPETPFEDTLAYYSYNLPEELIAQAPLPRGTERLLTLSKDGRRGHHRFSELPELLPKNALLVANNSKVMPVRVPGTRPTGGKSECLLLEPVPLVEQDARQDNDGIWCVDTDVLLKPSKAMPLGSTTIFPNAQATDGLSVTVRSKGEFGRNRVTLAWHGSRHGLTDFLNKNGNIPLPPYIKRAVSKTDLEAYQTIYSRQDKAGSAAAPTAGLHFTDQLRSELRAKGFGWAEVTLHVGYGTFAPVREHDIRQHVMHSEYIECPEETAAAINRAKASGRPVIAVGTTACRTLEGIAADRNAMEPYQGWTNIFIRPGYTWRVVDGLITNFHLPESTLLMLVSALAGHDHIMDAYAEAVKMEYRFFSYGDAMLIF